MKNLNPTLWRTCRMLAGTTRIRLLRELHTHPGQSVSELARAVGIKKSDASQALRRIQSRGLLRSRRHGAALIYRMEPDPQVVSAAPLLRALNNALSQYPPERDAELCRLAHGLAYPRRIALAQAIIASPQTQQDLVHALNLPNFAVFSHLRILMDCGYIRRDQRRFRFMLPDHPLASVLVRLLRSA